MNAPSIWWILLALVAGLVGGAVGGLMGGCDDCPGASGPSTVPAHRPLAEERQLIEAQGDWAMRPIVASLQPKVLEVGEQVLVFIPAIHWKTGQKFDVDFEFYRWHADKLVQVPVEGLD